MTVSATTPRNDYTGNNSTATYSYTFEIYHATDLLVMQTDTEGNVDTLSYPSDYTVSGVNRPSGGTITLTAGNLPTGEELAILFSRTPRQETDLRNQGSFLPEVHERKFDELTRYVQQLEEKHARTLKIPQPEIASTANTTLPTATERASKFLAFDADGDPVVTAGTSGDIGPVTPFAETLLDDADDDDARATLQAPRAAVVLLVNTSDGWALFDEDGAAIDISSSTTSGLQEAITYAFSNNKPLVVTGGGTLACTTAITVPAGFKDSLLIETGITIAFGTLGSANLITMDSQENCEIRIKAIVTQTAGNTGAVFAIKPTNAAPVTGNTAVAASVFEFGTAAPATGGTGLLIDLGGGGVIGNKIFIADVNGGVAGIRVSNPGSAFIAFEENHIEWAYIHSQSGHGIRVGSSSTNQTTMRRNLWICGRLAPTGASSIGFDTWGSSDVLLHLSASDEQGTLNKGLVFESGSSNNNVIGVTIVGASTIGIENSGAGNVVISSGIAVPMGGSTSTCPTVGKANASLTQVSTAANTNETNLQTYSLPANAFNSNGNSVRIRAWGSFAANANNKTVKLYFGSTAFVSSGTIAANDTKWIAEGTVHRTGSNTQKAVGQFRHSTSNIAVQLASLSETDSSAITIKVTGQNGSASLGDIVCEGMTVDFGN